MARLASADSAAAAKAAASVVQSIAAADVVMDTVTRVAMSAANVVSVVAVASTVSGRSAAIVRVRAVTVRTARSAVSAPATRGVNSSRVRNHVVKHPRVKAAARTQQQTLRIAAQPCRPTVRKAHRRARKASALDAVRVAAVVAAAVEPIALSVS